MNAAQGIAIAATVESDVGDVISASDDVINALHQGAVVSSVLSQLEQLIVSEEWTHPTLPSPNAAEPTDAKPKRKRVSLPKLSELGRSVVTSYSLKAYVNLLGPQHRQNIASWLYSNTLDSLSSIFRYENAAGIFHADELRGGVTEILRMALKERYPEAATRGFAAFAEAEPVVFLSPALHYDLSSHITAECGVGNVITVAKMDAPLAQVEGRLDQVWLESELGKLEGKRAVLVVAVVGSAFFGQNDLISKLLELRERHGFWLHVVGHGLAALGLPEPPKQLLVSSSLRLLFRLLELRERHGFWLHVVGHGLAALGLPEPPKQLLEVLGAVDSLTLPLGQWLGLQAVPALTLYRSKAEVKASYREKLEALPWWIALHHLGPARVSSALNNAYTISQAMLKELSRHKQIQILGVTNAPDYAAKVEKGALLPPTVVVFKYTSSHLPPVEKQPVEGEELSPEATVAAQNAEYLDCLNSWLAQGLIAECPLLGLHLAELGNPLGTAIRYCALESSGSYLTTEAEVASFGRQLEETLGILDATVTARARLGTLLQDPASPLLSLTVQKWAGVGAVCYVPSMVREGSGKEAAGWGEKATQQVAHLNIELVHSLRASDSAFSVGEDRRGLACVKFGMLADHSDLEDLVRMVSERGKQIEESAQYMESLADMIRQGIEAANQDLKKENDDRLMQEGVMRQVPLVGGFLNWLSPLPKETLNIKGRAFDLKTGRIQSTDVIYKHKLQMEMEGAGAGVPLTPVTPIATPQTPHGVPSTEEQEADAEAKAE